MSKGGLIVSIDFELNWGYRNSNHILSTEEVHNGLNTLKQLLDDYEIKSTWATVGQLFINCDKDIITNEKKTSNIVYDTANWIEKELKSDPKVEIGSHTFKHIFLLESSKEEQRIDYEQMKQLEPLGYKFDTIVFPRNQYNLEILKLSQSFGIRYFRGIKKAWWLQSYKHTKENKIKQIIKRICELLPFDRSVEISKHGNIINISDSRFFRFFSDSTLGSLLTLIYRNTLKYELKYALKKGYFYHIWFHPHNVISRPNRVGEFEEFLQYFNTLKDQYKVNSYTIKEVAEANK